jgi:glycosyltransferase involved in cell wall biosynthesis
LKIVHLNKNDIQGGAARAAYRLHKGLQRVGHESLMFVESRTSHDPSVVLFDKPTSGLSFVRRGLRQVGMSRERSRYQRSRPPGFELFSDDRSPYAASVLDQLPRCEVVNLHWIPGFVDYTTFFSKLTPETRIFWTLHDLNAMTGGCHYDLGCGRYLSQCGNCPQLGSADSGDLSHAIWERKQRLFAKLSPDRLTFVTPSRWLSDEVRHSPILDRFPVHVIPNGVDIEAFAPRNRANVRDLLEIPQDARVLLFLAEEVGNKRKGFRVLLEALAQCAGRIPNLLLLSLGQNKPDVESSIPWVHIDALSNDRFLSMVYSAADLFAICSLQDNLPNTVLEALACGVPVVGNATGGIPDMVRDGVNGLTAPADDVGALAEAICQILNNDVLRAEMSVNARRVAVDDYTLDLQARRYADLYASRQ